jgi:hypothetical protein
MTENIRLISQGRLLKDVETFIAAAYLSNSSTKSMGRHALNQVRSHMAGIMTYLEEHNVFEGTLAEIAEMSGQPRSYKSCALAASILRSCNAIQVSNTGTVFRLDLAFPEEFFSLYEPGDWKVNRHISLSTHRSAYSRTDKDILSIQSGGYNLNFKQIGSGLLIAMLSLSQYQDNMKRSRKARSSKAESVTSTKPESETRTKAERPPFIEPLAGAPLQMKLCREDMDTLSSMYHVDRVQLDGFLKQMLLMMDALELNYRRNFIDLSNQVRDLGSKVDRLLEELGVNSPTQEEEQ